MKTKIYILLFLLSSTSAFAGTATSEREYSSNMSYEDCINKIYFDPEVLYEAANGKILKRDKDDIILEHTSVLGKSHYKARESRTLTKKEAVFKTHMYQKIDGTLKLQTTIIKVKNIKEKAQITIIISVSVDHIFATNKSIKDQIDHDIQKILYCLESDY